MKYDHLILSMESGAEEKIRDIRGRTDREREEIIREARSSGEQLKQEILADIRRKADYRNEQTTLPREGSGNRNDC